MLNRRDFLIRTLQNSSLLAVGSVVPQFLTETALAADSGKDTVLVVVELSGGNDGLNTVIPYADDLYHKARPTLHFKKDDVIKVDDYVGLHPGMNNLRPMLDKGQLAIVQGVGYPNPDRSHFESMDIWQSADPKRKIGTGWIGRSVPDLQDKKGNVPVMQLGKRSLPLALQGAPGGVASLNNPQEFRLNIDAADPNKRYTRKKLIEDLAQASEPADKNSLLPFVQRRQLQTYATLERLQEALKELNRGNRKDGVVDDIPQFTRFFNPNQLVQKLQLVANLIIKGFGTRVFYVALDGFDTHSNQAEEHRRLLGELSDAINTFFNTLQPGDHGKRVLLLTFSEFGRRVHENSSRGTDHGAGSCLFVAGPAVNGGAIGKHPSLSELDAGDLRFQTDFRCVYATLLDQWLGCNSRTVLGEKWDHLDLLKTKS
jgi:uncharacterized protein (DUF1501 family)